MGEQAVTSGAYRNNSATVLYGGNADGTVVTNTPGISVVGSKKGYGSKVVLSGASPASSGNIGVLRAMGTQGNFAQMVPGTYVIRTVSTTLAGVANTVLKSGAAEHARLRRPINDLRGVTTSHLSGLSWSGNSYTFTKATQRPSFGTDDAVAQTTAAVPGELVYLVTGKVPTQDEYQPRTS